MARVYCEGGIEKLREREREKSWWDLQTRHLLGPVGLRQQAGHVASAHTSFSSRFPPLGYNQVTKV